VSSNPPDDPPPPVQPVPISATWPPPGYTAGPSGPPVTVSGLTAALAYPFIPKLIG
jgi:hypothetical protein